MIDALGHPIREGDTVLTGAYWSSTMDMTTTVTKVTKKSVYVCLKVCYFDYQKGVVVEDGVKEVRRKPSQVVVITQQLKHNQEHYPENLL